jgi:hypothetical protein
MAEALLVARTLRQALLVSVLLLLDAAVFATEAAAPAALAARWPPRTQRRRLLAEGLAAASTAVTAVTTTGCTGASAGLAADQCAAWGKFFDGAGGPNWTNWGQGCSNQNPCGCCPYGAGSCSVTCSGSSITEM